MPTSRDNRSAFSADEIAVLKEWTEHGGSLLLITDHMPDPPAMAGLAAAFGITLLNGYVLNDNPAEGKGPIYFRRSDGTLADHAVTRGRPDYDETISSVTSFTGCAFRAPDGFEPLMTLGPLKTCWLTEKEGEFPEGTPTVDVEGWYQGGLFEPGRGRAAFFAEAGMFSAQIIGGTVKFGMNADIAPQNAQFVLNLMHWLDGLI